MDPSKPVCERCGAPAIVHFTGEGPAACGVRHLCLDCADRRDAAPFRKERGLNHAAIVLVTGMMILMITLFADVLRFGGGQGFGFKQMIGLIFAGGGLLVGAVTRIPTLYVVGGIAGGLTLLADYVQFGKSPGFGLEQMTGLGVGFSILLLGMVLAARQRV